MALVNTLVIAINTMIVGCNRVAILQVTHVAAVTISGVNKVWSSFSWLSASRSNHGSPWPAFFVMASLMLNALNQPGSWSSFLCQVFQWMPGWSGMRWYRSNFSMNLRNWMSRTLPSLLANRPSSCSSTIAVQALWAYIKGGTISCLNSASDEVNLR